MVEVNGLLRGTLRYRFFCRAGHDIDLVPNFLLVLLIFVLYVVNSDVALVHLEK